jgi:hypothetical protein
MVAGKDAKLAREALERARRHYQRAQDNTDDADEVFVWCFYALENAVVAAALHSGAEFIKSHWSKATAARKLSQKYPLTDVSRLLSDLNEARKGTAYGDVDEPEIDPEDVLTEVGEYIEEVAAFLQPKKAK